MRSAGSRARIRRCQHAHDEVEFGALRHLVLQRHHGADVRHRGAGLEAQAEHHDFFEV
jgi:hypothetical protein